MSIEEQLEQNRQKRDSSASEVVQLRTSVDTRTSVASSERTSIPDSARNSMPYATLDPKERMKQLMKNTKESDSDDSEWSSSDSEVEEKPKEEVKALSLEESKAVLEGWIEEITLEGHVYYRNEVTNDVRWDMPKTSQQKTFDSAWVWIPHPKEAYAPAKLIQDLGNGKVLVQKVGDLTPTELSGPDAAKCVPLNKAELAHITHDLVLLEQPTNPLILHNLRSRFLADKIYTRIGSIIIAVNPFKPLPLYTGNYINKIKCKGDNTDDPHIFEIPAACIKLLREKAESQSIIISGESGAGKTETTKHCLQYLAEVVGSESGVDQNILMANPLLEAFGNAKTLRNDNSSRFGKWIEVYFGLNGRITGAKIINYLLEKSRVIYQDAGERNYHIFYLLCKQAHEYPSLGLHEGSWNYIKDGKLSHNELEKFNEMMTAMENFNITKERALNIFELVAAVLHLGNVEIVNTGDSCRIQGSPSLDKACELLHISPDLLNQTMCSRLLDTSKDKIYKSLSYAECVESTGNFAKLLYSKLFDWLVNLVNSQLYNELCPMSSQLIGALDIFGFEIFKHNSFEQFCINYANEKLQQHFNYCTFKHEEEVYTSEAIHFEHIEFKDNIPILELIEKPGSGIMMFLNDEIMLPRGSDESLIKKLHSNFNSHASYNNDIKDPNRFLLHHYAGDVTYDIRGFLLKNTDRVSEDLVSLITSSGNSLMKELFGELKASKKPIASQFKLQLDQMMARIGQTNSHFVRCIKANAQKVRDKFDAPLVLEQLKYSGVFEAVGIRQKGFPFRLSHEDFIHRYKNFNLKFTCPNKKQYCTHLLNLLGNYDGFRVGQTQVFYRYVEHKALELKRNVCINGIVVNAQKSFKRHMAIKLKIALLEAKPHFEAAIRSGDVARLDETINRYNNLTFEIKAMSDAKILRAKLIERKDIEDKIVKLNYANPETCYDELESMINRANKIDYNSEAVEEARQKYELAKNIRNVRQQFSKIRNSHVPIDEIDDTVARAISLGLEGDTDFEEVKRAFDKSKKEITAKKNLASSMLVGGPSVRGEDYTATVRVEELDRLIQALKDLKPWYNPGIGNILKAAEFLVSLRMLLIAGEWEELDKKVSAEASKHPALSALHELAIVKEELIYRTNVKDVIAKLEAAIEDKQLSSIKLYLQQGETLHIEWSPELNAKASETRDRLELIHAQIAFAEENKIQAELERAVEMCTEFNYYNEEVERVTQLRDAIIMFNKETALALNVCEFEMLNRQLRIAKTMGIQENPLINDIKVILFECDELMQRHIQHMVALELGDIALIIDRNIAFCDARLMPNKALYDWKAYPGFKDPTAWASSKWTRRAERAAGFFKFSKEKIHESLTKLDSKLNEKAIECNTSIRVVMGDKIASNPMLEAKSLLIKVYKFPKLKEEVLLQLMKQLTKNPSPTSVAKGWKLFALLLRTFTSRALEERIFVFLRENCPSSISMLRLLFYSIVAQASKKPSQEFVDSEFNAPLDIGIKPDSYSVETHPHLTKYESKIATFISTLPKD